MARVQVITPGASARSETRPLIAALAQQFDVQATPWVEGPWPVRTDVDAVVSFAKFRHLLRADTVDWRGFDGLRVHYDWDALQDAHWHGSPYRGTYAPTLQRLGFDLVVTTGLRSRDGLRAQGLKAETLHKAADPSIRDLGYDRSTLYGTYGAEYPARARMKAELRRAGITVQSFKAPFDELGVMLNRFIAVLTCTFESRLRLPALGRRLYRWAPRLFVVPGDAPEPMGKLFEVAAAGAAPFVDWTPDLEQLGFVDGVNAVIYRTFDDLVERARAYQTDIEGLRRIGRNAAVVAAQRHTWPVRATELQRLIEHHLR